MLPSSPASGLPVNELAELAVEFVVGEDGVLTGRLEGTPAWRPEWPFDDDAFVGRLAAFRSAAARPLPLDDRGRLSPAAAARRAALLASAVALGDRLARVFSPEALARLAAAEAVARSAGPVLLRIQVAVAADGDAGGPDELLALPWELLRVNGRFPVEQHTFDLVREAKVPHLPGLREPAGTLEVVATAAAPTDHFPVDHEGEMFHLWKALGDQDEGRLQVADLGTLEELVALVREHQPPAIHFVGHGAPGGLLFEDDLAQGDLVEVDELIRQLRANDGPLPSLIYLSACYGMNPEAAAHPSTAAALHRGGFAQVVGYFGPVGDRQATRLAGLFYNRLAQGQKARAALRAVRELAVEPLPHEGGRVFYPLGWTQIALYHRGADLPTALPSGGATRFVVRSAREFVRLDRRGGIPRVERRHDQPLVGVQQLRDGFGFIGRRGPRAAALQSWRGGARLLVVQGLGGLGKTTLCAELLRLLPTRRVLALDGRFAAAQDSPLEGLWREIQAARDQDPGWQSLLGQLLENGFSAAALAAALAILTEREGELIAYLDDTESLLEEPGDGALGRWRSPELGELWRLLVGMAEPGGAFGLVASTRYQPEGTPHEAMLPLSGMSRWETLRLLAWMPTLGRLPHDDREWLAGQVDGHPRTIEWLEVLAAAAERRLAPPGGEWHGEWRRVLEPILGEAGEKIASDLLLERVWQSLEPADREHLGRLRVLSAPAPWEAISHLESAPGSAGRLVNAGLLSPYESPGGPPWWAPHSLVAAMVHRLYPGEDRDAHRRLGQWYLSQLGEEDVGLYAQRAAEHLCAGGDGAAAFPVVQRLALSLAIAGRYREAGVLFERLSAQVEGTLRARTVSHHVLFQAVSGVAPEDGEERLLAILPLAPAPYRSDVLSVLSMVAFLQGRLEPAQAYLLELTEEEFNFGDEGFALLGYSMSIGICLVTGELEAAQALLQPLADSDDLKENPLLAHLLLHQAQLLEQSGESAAAEQLLTHLAPIFESIFPLKTHPTGAILFLKLGSVLRAQKKLDAAQEKLEIAIGIAGQAEVPMVSILAQSELAEVFRARGDRKRARELFELAQQAGGELFRSGRHPMASSILSDLASLDREEGNFAAARQRLEQALEINIRLHSEKDLSVAMNLYYLAEVARKEGQLEEARSLYLRSLEIETEARGTEEHPSIADSLFELAKVTRDLGDLPEARRLFERAIETETGHFASDERQSIANSFYFLAEVLERQDDPAGAMEAFGRVLRIEEKLYGGREKYWTALAELSLGRLAIEHGDRDEGRRLLRHARTVFAREKGDRDPNLAEADRLLEKAGPSGVFGRALAALRGLWRRRPEGAAG